MKTSRTSDLPLPFQMKTTLFALLCLTTAVAPFALAQDPTVAVPTERTENARGLATPSASSLPPEASDESPTPAATPKSSAAKKSSGPKSNAVDTLRDLENKWVASVAAHDPSVAQRLLAEDYAGVSSRGQTMSKAALVAQIKRDTDKYSAAKMRKMDVRIYGDAAVVIGSSNENGKDGRGHSFQRAYRWTDTWIRRNGAWQCVASQSAPIAN